MSVNHLTLTAFYDWAKRKTGSYDYTNGCACACAQYADRLGIDYHTPVTPELFEDCTSFWKQIEYLAGHAPRRAGYDRTYFADLAAFVRRHIDE